MLLVDWFEHLARESGLTFTQRGGGPNTFTSSSPADAFHVRATVTEHRPFLDFVASDPSRQDAVDAIAAKAVDRVERRDLGGIVWYSAELRDVEFKLSPMSMVGSVLRRLDRQSRITGWGRLGANVLLEFIEEAQTNPSLAPRTIVNVHIAAPGPCAGHFASTCAHGVVETVAAICTFALGRPVELPPSVFPSDAGMLPQLHERRMDRRTLTLARKGMSLDILTPLGAPGGIDLFQRVRAALLTFDSAERQERDSVACILYVAAAECLAMPYTAWGGRSSRSGSRSSLTSLCRAFSTRSSVIGSSKRYLVFAGAHGPRVPCAASCWSRCTRTGRDRFTRGSAPATNPWGLAST